MHCNFIMKKVLILFFCLSSFIIAQESAKRTCRILYLGAPADAPKELILYDGKNPQKVELPSMNLSPVYKLASGDITIRLLTKEPPNAEEVNPAAPSVAIPASVTDCYLLIAQNPKNTVAPISMQLVNASPAKFGKGEMLWFNLTPHLIGGVVGERKLLLKPMSQSILKSPTTKIGDYPIKIGYQISGSERAYPITETKWIHDPKARSVVFVVSRGGNGLPAIMSFPDFRQQEKEEE